MIDSGATGTAFVDSSFVQDNNLKINLLPQPLRLRVVDGRPSSAGDITTTTTFALDIKGHTETLTAFVTKLHNYNIILGKPWLRKHNPSNIDWDSNVLSFNSNFCKTHCLLQGCHQIAVSGLKFTPKPADKSLSPSVASGPLPRRLGAAAFHTVAKQPGVDVFSASLHEINSRLETEFQVDLASLDSSPSTIPRPEVHQRRTRFEHGVNQMELDLNALRKKTPHQSNENLPPTFIVQELHLKIFKSLYKTSRRSTLAPSYRGISMITYQLLIQTKLTSFRHTGAAITPLN